MTLEEQWQREAARSRRWERWHAIFVGFTVAAIAVAVFLVDWIREWRIWFR